MTTETYQELFYYTAFPVFAIRRGTGEIIYKNLSCAKYLPKLSDKKSVYPFIFSQNFDGVGAVKLAQADAYHTAIALEDGDHSVFLFLGYLQYENGMLRASQAFREFGPSLTDFLAALHMQHSVRMMGSILPGTNRELYTQVPRLTLDERDPEYPAHTLFYPIATDLFEKLNTAFLESGYHVHARIEEDFPTYLYTEAAIKDILFVLGRLLYLPMKLSKNKTVNILLSCDIAYSRYAFYITAETTLFKLWGQTEETMELLLDFIPEGKMEFSLLYKTGLLTKENFIAGLDRFGNLFLSYRVPYISPETYYVRSIDMQNAFLLKSVDTMIDSLIARLTDNGASC